ncbi:MAG: diaminopimelate epimerase [SAR86 cluster bacterium]|uniref:Diaminopimelate epimerase n=1 Tax=SAR86 cluster bacterium TaxID=2030880 RepID=A0A2A4X0B6_9GAMM|nr:MAG: diaminopimelate epimerase [SAR86 cluster bacterium]
MDIHFTKMHGLGNDFIVLNNLHNEYQLSAEQIALLGHRRFGVGFDQLLSVEAASEPGIDFSYRIFNQDGQEAEHCGNGARCFAKYVIDKGLFDGNTLVVRTVNRVLTLNIRDDGSVTVDMEAPVFTASKIPFIAGSDSKLHSRQLTVSGSPLEIEFCALSVGNPHAVIRVEDLGKTAVKEIGEALGAHPDFPEGCNVGFMQLRDRNTIDLRVYERGAGETLACGTGACAAVVAGCLQGLLDDTVRVKLQGGELSITWLGIDTPILMTGPATTVFEGKIQI